MKKLYRQQNGSLEDSLNTSIEVNSLKDILDYVNKMIYKNLYRKNYCSNISTSFVGDDSTRCGNDWKETYYVLADFGDYKQLCIGMCNFKD